MAKASIKVSKFYKTKSGGKKGNPNKCPVCGKFMGSGGGKNGRKKQES